ncbi:hypothetical protein GC173_08855, partial [bacterium]|nr:hypothetical protein [bacterium]
MKKKTTVQRKTSPTAEQTSAAPESLAAVTVVYVDGNSVAAMAVSRHGEGYRVEALEHLEVDRLLEVIKRLRHPIFMDLNFCLMPEKELIQQYFQRFISKPASSHPTGGLLVAEKLVPTALAG